MLAEPVIQSAFITRSSRPYGWSGVWVSVKLHHPEAGLALIATTQEMDQLSLCCVIPFT